MNNAAIIDTFNSDNTNAAYIKLQHHHIMQLLHIES